MCMNGEQGNESILRHGTVQLARTHKYVCVARDDTRYASTIECGEKSYTIPAHPFSPRLNLMPSISKTFRGNISRLYRRLSGSNLSLALESRRRGAAPVAQQARHATRASTIGKWRARFSSLALADVWGGREELFGAMSAMQTKMRMRIGTGKKARSTAPAPPVHAHQEGQYPARPKTTKVGGVGREDRVVVSRSTWTCSALLFLCPFLWQVILCEPTTWHDNL